MDSRLGSLRAKNEEFWKELVLAADAKILSKLSNDHCDSYLLSESSLFVWDDRFILITCGTTTLVKSIEWFCHQVPVDSVSSLIYQRKNEYFPHLQKTGFFQDLESLKKFLPGRAFRFGPADGHHLFLFHLDRDYSPVPEDRTIEILMYHIHGPAKEILCQCGQSPQDIRRLMNFGPLMEGFELDDFVFEPCGYSVNGLRGEEYFTVHVTPQEESSYVSFESNVRVEQPNSLLRSVLQVFQPQSFDLVSFGLHCPDIISDYQRQCQVSQNLGCGYEVDFNHFQRPNYRISGAKEIQM